MHEIVVVFAIMGALVGGIWTAYGSVAQSKKIAQAMNQIRYITTHIHALSASNPKVLNVLLSDPGCTVGFKVCGTFSDICQAPSPLPAGFPGCGATPTCTSCTFVSAASQAASCAASAGPTGPSAGKSETLSTQLVQSGIFPLEMISGNGTVPSPYVIRTPWDSSVTISISTSSANECALAGYASIIPAAQAAVAALAAATSTTQTTTVFASNAGATYTFSGTFTLNYPAVPKTACARLLMSNGAELVQMGLSSLRAGSYGTNSPSAATLTPANIAGWCNGAGTTSTLAFTFPIQLN